ncbi:MAG: HAD-IIIA family hydrolase [Bdellovibrionales bacterium]|nr:HAD-IIIA family hydrolase [Bdellovibrionales bacterium]
MSLSDLRQLYGLGFLHLLLSWQAGGKLLLPASLRLPVKVRTFLNRRFCIGVYNKIGDLKTFSLGPHDVVYAVNARPELGALFSKVVTANASAIGDGSFDLRKLNRAHQKIFLNSRRFLRSSAARPIVPCLFLDRDGVVIEHVPYIKDPRQVKLKPGITSLISRFREQEFRIVLVSNQSGIARKYFTYKDYFKVQTRMQTLLAQEGVWLDAAYSSMYFEESDQAHLLSLPSLRKPRPGALFVEELQWDIDKKRSIFVGDNISDMEMAQNMGLKKAYLVENSALSEANRKKISLKFKRIESLAEISD